MAYCLTLFRAASALATCKKLMVGEQLPGLLPEARLVWCRQQ